LFGGTTMKPIQKDLLLLILCLAILAWFWMNPVPAGGDKLPPALVTYYVRLPLIQAGDVRYRVPIIFKSPAGVRVRVRETGNRYTVGAAGEVIIRVTLPVTLEVEAPAMLACVGRLIVVEQPGIIKFCL
jgi:hypothetical protein